MSNVEMLKVRCGENGAVHREGGQREIDAATGKDLNVISKDHGVVEVPSTRYYRRRIQVGDLIAVTEDSSQPAGRTWPPSGSE